MDVSSIAAMATANAMTNLRQAVSISVLEKSMDIQEQSAVQLLNTLPPVPVVNGGTVGAIIDIWA